MANTLLPITDFYRDKYNNVWMDSLQQSQSKLTKFADCSYGVIGKAMEYSFLASLELQEKTGRFERVVLDETDQWKRRILPRSFDGYVGFETDDPIFMDGLDAPMMKTIDNLKKAKYRMDDQVLLGVVKNGNVWKIGKGGLLGTNYAGNDGTDEVNPDPNLVIAHNYVESGSAKNSLITIDKLFAAIQMFRENGVIDETNTEAQLCMAITAADAIALAREDKMQNNNYGFQALKKLHGMIDPIMGIQFIITEMLPKDSDGHIICPIWEKTSLKYCSWKDATIKVSERDDLKDAIQIKAKAIMGAARLREEGLIQIKSYRAS